MKNLFGATVYRMVKSTGVKAALGLTFAAAISYYILAGLLAKGSLDPAQAGSVAGLGDAMIVWLFGSLIIGLLVGSDFEKRTIHGAVKRGRGKTAVNYMAVFSLFTVLTVLPYTLGSAALIMLGADMAGAEETAISVYMFNVLKYSDDSSAFKLILSYISYAAVYIGQLSICVPVSVKLKKPVAVTAFGFFFGMITALINTLVSKVNVLEKIYSLTPYSYGIDKLGINADTDDMLMEIAVSVVFTGLMGVLSWIILRKADIK